MNDLLGKPRPKLSYKKWKILNLYAGIGGNRKLWDGDIEVTAVEINPKIAKIYQDFFPNDKVIVTDAHQFLLEHYDEFDFIWSSPPCPTHSQVRYRLGVLNGKAKPVYPDMKLYEEIIFLKHHFKGKWVVENTEPYYEPLIKPQICGRHRFWSNFLITKIEEKGSGVTRWGSVKDKQRVKGFDLDKYNGINKVKILRKCVNPETGLHILSCARNNIQQKLVIKYG